jgi:hypothetical protein
MMISSNCFGIPKKALFFFYFHCWLVCGLQLYILIVILRYQIYSWDDEESHENLIMRLVSSLIIIVFEGRELMIAIDRLVL